MVPERLSTQTVLTPDELDAILAGGPVMPLDEVNPTIAAVMLDRIASACTWSYLEIIPESGELEARARYSAAIQLLAARDLEIDSDIADDVDARVDQIKRVLVGELDAWFKRNETDDQSACELALSDEWIGHATLTYGEP